MNRMFLLAVATCIGHVQAQKLENENVWEIVNIENPSVNAFMSDSTYYLDSNYQNSVVKIYNSTRFLNARRDVPNGKVVTWEPTVSDSLIEEIRILVSENEDFSDCQFFNTSTLDVNSYVISNMLPNKTYYYKVEEIHKDATLEETASGVFRTIGQVRMIRVEGSRNVRDLGGWNTQFGKTIRYGRLFRSGNLDNVTPVGIQDFKENLGVMAELDLRGGDKYVSSPLGSDVEFVNYENNYYTNGLSKFSSTYAKQLTWVIDRLREDRNVDWHCNIGCDRCGTFSFLVGGLLGMSEVDLCRDYEMSVFAGHDRERGFSDDGMGSFSSLIPYIRNFGSDDDLASCFFNYFVSSGVDPEDLNYLREEMLVGNEEFSDPTGCNQIEAKTTCIQSPLRIYSANGVARPTLQNGLNIIIGEDGTSSKCYIK